VYTPHSGSGSTTRSVTTNKPSTPGPTVYTPHAATPSANGGSEVGSAKITTPPSSSANVHSTKPLSPATSKLVDQLNAHGKISNPASSQKNVTTAGGRQYAKRPDGSLASFSNAHGLNASFGHNGHVRSIQTSNMKIQYGPHGGQTVTKQLPNRAKLVSYGVHSGYVERTVVRNNATIVQRTYLSQGRTFVRVYSPYSYRGVVLDAYAPGLIYAPAFYGWAYYPWAAPVAFGWGWGGESWFGFYGGYFAPLPLYASPSLWMTDYILGSTLAEAYQEQQDAAGQAGMDVTAQDPGPAPGGNAPSDDAEASAQTSTPITPELRAAIAEEVRQELAAENGVANNHVSADVQQISSDLQEGHLFVVADLLSVPSDQGNCALTGGDIISVLKPTGSDAQTAVLAVASSKRGDCPAGAKVVVALADLQEMDNSLRAQMDSALAKLHSIQGQGGIPAAPKSAIGPPPRPAMDDMPAAEQDVPTLLAAEEREAAKEETQVNLEAFASGASH